MAQQILIATVMAVGLAQVGYAFVTTKSAEHRLRSVCAVWDREARTAVALDRSETGVVAGQLDRAREYCRAGRLGLARQDYQAFRTVQAVATPAAVLAPHRRAPAER